MPDAEKQAKELAKFNAIKDRWSDVHKLVKIGQRVTLKTADGNLTGIITKVDSMNYPPDLQTMVDGVEIQTKKVKFLRAIPKDPMTGDTDWGLRSNQDDADSDSWGGQNVFDVHSKSNGTALDGTKYNTW